MKFLNLDELAKTNRTITLAGNEHAVVEMTVENFIETTKAAEALSKGDPTFAEQMEASIEMIVRSVPTLDTATLRKLSLEQLTKVLQFLRGDLDAKAAPAQEKDAAPGK